MDNAADTDLLVVLLRSLLAPGLADSLPEAAVLIALADADGSVELAADALRRGGGGGGSSTSSTLSPALARASVAGGKRGRGPTVADWLDSPAKRRQEEEATGQQPPSTYYQRLAAGNKRPPPVAAQPAPPKPPASLPPLLLATPKLLAQHLPCVVVPKSPLPPDLASALYLALMADSERWTKNKYIINGRQVESPHTTAFYQSALAPPYPPDEMDESARFWNNNAPSPTPPPFPPLLQQAAQLVEDAVNAELDARPDARKFAGEWKGRWKAGVAGVNRYEGSASGVGPHADQLTYLGPYPTIASLSLGTSRKFRLRQVPSKDPAVRALEGEPRTFDVPLVHNTLLLMVPPCQEKFKHSIPTQPSIDAFRPAYGVDGTLFEPEERTSFSSRIAVTFRFYRPDFAPGGEQGTRGRRREGTPRCACGLPCTLKADQRNTVSLSLRPSSTVASPKRAAAVPPISPASAPAAAPAAADPFLFYWTCTKRAGWAGQDDGAGGGAAKKDGQRDGCAFFRVFDLRREGRDCGVPS